MPAQTIPTAMNNTSTRDRSRKTLFETMMRNKKQRLSGEISKEISQMLEHYIQKTQHKESADKIIHDAVEDLYLYKLNFI
jgi:hypothetical protein